MANAKPSRPGTKKVETGPQGEISIPVGSVVGRLPDGTVVARTTYNNGNIKDIKLFTEDHPNAKPFEE
jgi:hypothetical protein